MRKILLSLIFVITLFSCSDTEPITFLETNNLSVWERTGYSDPEQKFYMRILSNPDRIAEKWSPTNTDIDCYDKDLFEKLFDLSFGTDTENNLTFTGFSVKSNTFTDGFSFSIRNDTLTLIVSRSSGNPDGGNGYTKKWVKSNVNVDDLIRCK